MLKIIALVSFLSAVALANESSDCDGKYNITRETWTNLNKDVLNPAENVLCYMKCSYERDGILDSLGKINKDKLDVEIEKYTKLTAEEKTAAHACIDGVAPAKTCEDMKPIHLCIHKREAKQSQ